MVKTSDALKIINKMNHGDPELEDMIAQASLNADVAQLIYEHRNKAGLTQKQLAELVGIEESIITQLEDADFDGKVFLSFL